VPLNDGADRPKRCSADPRGCRRGLPGIRGRDAGGRANRSEPSRDHRTALMAPRQLQRRRRGQGALRPPRLPARKCGWQTNTRWKMVLLMPLSARIGMELSVNAANGTAPACVPSHGSMPRRPSHVGLTTAVHAGHRYPLHDDRFLSHRPDTGNRRSGGDDRGSDDGVGNAHETRPPRGRDAAVRCSHPGRSTSGATGFNEDAASSG
jgi:hypothetical protein